jgi:sugar lactone lactonase YvrE
VFADAAVVRGPEDLAVTDYSNTTFILNDAYHVVRVVGSFSVADGDTYDTQGNLYVADPVRSVVYEYNQSYNLIARYFTGTPDPINVTTDAAGNVYVADFGGGEIVEFPQGVNTPSASCPTGIENEGIAVDAKHDVFVIGNESSIGPGVLVEYKGGLTNCSETHLSGISLGFAGGLQMDRRHNLVACDQDVGVDIIPPPYTSISSTIKGGGDSFHAALDKKNTLIYIADLSNSDVLVDKYPSGTNVTTIGAANGLDGAAGVAAFPN